MKCFTTLTAPAVVVPLDYADADQILPPRFRGGSGAELGRHLFGDLPLAAERVDRAEILVGGADFGRGSVREDAVRALLARGIKAVIAPSFADAFFANALVLGLAPIALAPGDHAALTSRLAADAAAPVTIDIAAQRVVAPGGGALPFQLGPLARTRLLEGIDQLAILLGCADLIDAYEQTRPSLCAAHLEAHADAPVTERTATSTAPAHEREHELLLQLVAS